MKWSKPAVDPLEVRHLASRYGVNVLVSSILIRRGWTDPATIRFLLEHDPRHLHNPFLLPQMDDAVERISAAVATGELIAVFGDRDVDGVTSTVLMVQTLGALGAAVSWRLPEGDDSYGLTATVIDELAAADVQLLITVDCGVTAVEEIAKARQLGMDVVVVDHHEPPAEPPDAIVVDPKLKDSRYPFRDLSACGLVAKVAAALAFAGSDIYGETLCLLDVRPLNDAIAIEAVKVTNLVKGATLFETAVPGAGHHAAERLAEFADGCEIFVYDEPLVRRLLSRACGPLDLFVHDLAPQLAGLHPALANKSLLQLRERSRLSRYVDGTLSELDMLREVFELIMRQQHAAVMQTTPQSLELAALSTIADLMPLRDENRIIVRHGLQGVAATERIGLRELLGRAKLYGKDLVPSDMSFQISPLINSAGRLGEASVAARLLLTEDAEEARRLADRIGELNQQRRTIGDEGWNRAQHRARDSFDATGGKLVWSFDDRVPRGITGMLAARLVDAFQVPALVVAVQDEESTGSMRSLPGLTVGDLLGSLDDLLPRWGGHAMAGGFSIPTEQLPALEERLRAFTETMDAVAPSDEARTIDAEIPPAYLSPDVWETAALFAPYGAGNRPLACLTRGLHIASVELIGKSQPGHVKLLLDAGNYKWPGLFWNAAERVGKDFAQGDRVDVVYRLTKSFFNEVETLQLTIHDLERSQDGTGDQDGAGRDPSAADPGESQTQASSDPDSEPDAQ